MYRHRRPIARRPLEELAHDASPLRIGVVRLDAASHSGACGFAQWTPGQLWRKTLVELIGLAGESPDLGPLPGDDFANNFHRLGIAAWAFAAFKKIEKEVESRRCDQVLQGVVDRHVPGKNRQPVVTESIKAWVGCMGK